jgi:AcrR family transcriptional regulator
VAPTLSMERFVAVVAAAARVFVTHGFYRAQVQDIADDLGVGKGTLYGYAAGKRALFMAALRYGDGVEPLPDRSQLPLPPAGYGDLAALITSRLEQEVPTLALAAALTRDAPPAGATGPAEFAEVVVDLYRKLSKHRVAIKLVDRCSAEFPELRQAWLLDGRALQIAAVTEYLRRRGATDHLDLPARPELVARSTVETCVLWAVHRHWDPAGTPVGTPDGSADFDDEEVADMLDALLRRAVTPQPDGTALRDRA